MNIVQVSVADADDLTPWWAGSLAENPECWAVTGDAGEITSVLRLFSRWFDTGTANLRAVGIGCLYTVDALRGRGLARGLVGWVCDHLEACGVEVVIAHSRVDDSVFDACGFESIGPSPTRPDDQDLYLRWLDCAQVHPFDRYTITPPDHF